jgi:hypothetical protein
MNNYKDLFNNIKNYKNLSDEKYEFNKKLLEYSMNISYELKLSSLIAYKQFLDDKKRAGWSVEE